MYRPPCSIFRFSTLEDPKGYSMTYRSFRRDVPVRPSLIRVAVAGAIGLVTAIGSTSVSARPTQPSAADRQITLAVSMLMERKHLTQHALDDTISDRCLETYIKELDPLKLFFYQSD